MDLVGDGRRGRAGLWRGGGPRLGRAGWGLCQSGRRAPLPDADPRNRGPQAVLRGHAGKLGAGMSVAADQRAAYEALVNNHDGAFLLERPPLFSPAGPAQDRANPRGWFGSFGPLLLPAEYTDGWVQETAAHVRSAYLGDWTSLAKIIVRGRDALAFLSWLGLNNLSSPKIRQIRHHVKHDEHAWITS